MTHDDTHVFKFRSSSIDPEAVDQLVEAGGYESTAEYLRSLVRDDAQRRGIDLSGGGE